MPVNPIDFKTYTGIYHHTNKNGDSFAIEFEDGKPIKSVKNDENGNKILTKTYTYEQNKKTINSIEKDEFIIIKNGKFIPQVEENKTTTIIKPDSVRQYKNNNYLERWFQKFEYGWKRIDKYLHKSTVDDFLTTHNYYAIQGRNINDFLRKGKFKNVIYPQGYFSNAPSKYQYLEKDYADTMPEQSKIENRTLMEQICKIDDEIQNNHTESEVTVYRRAPKEWINTAVDGIITDSGFISTSLAPDAYWGYKASSKTKDFPLYKITLPKGTPYYDITDTSEKEMVLPRGSKFKVIDDTTLEYIPSKSNVSFSGSFFNRNKFTKKNEEVINDNSYINYLKKLYKTEDTVFTNSNGNKLSFTIFKDSRMGTNDGYYSINNSTGELFYTKIGGEQSKAEVLSSKLYNLAGINTPEMSLIKTRNGKTGLISKYIPDTIPVREPNQEVYKGFGMDCFLANWDAVISDNTITDGENVYRIDLGGSLDFRAMSINGKKPFPDEVNELSTMLNPSINYFGSRIFAEMTREELISSVKRVVDIKNDDIIQVLKNQNMLEYKDILLNRKEFMSHFLKIAEQTPFEHNSIFEYSTTILEKTKAESKKKISFDSFLKILEENGIKKSKDNIYRIDIPQRKKNDLIFSYGVTYGKKFISQLVRTFTEEDIKAMYKFMNINNGKYVDFWKQDILDLAIFYTLITLEKTVTTEPKIKNEIDNLPIGFVESLMDIAQDMPTTKFFGAFNYYKHSGYRNVNKYLIGGKKREEVVNKKQAEKIATTIQEYIDTKEIKTPFTVYRGEEYEYKGEDYEFLSTITMDNGEPLGKTLKNLLENPDEEKIKELNENIKRNKYCGTYKNFVSTAVFPNGYSEIGDISYLIEIQPKCKGIYAEAVNLENYMTHEHEFLIQAGSKLQIEEVKLEYCKYKESKNHWVIKAKILPAD